MPGPTPTAFVKVKLGSGAPGQVKYVNIEGTVQRVEVEDHDRLTDLARIVIDDAKGQLSHAPAEGQFVLIEMGWDLKETAPIFEGVVTNARPEGSDGASRLLTLTALDFSHLADLQGSKDGEQHTGKLSEIIEKVIGRYKEISIAKNDKGEKQILPDDDVQFSKDDPLLQRKGQSDWAFILELAAEHSCRAFVEYSSEKKKGDADDYKSRFYFIGEKRLFGGKPQGRLHYCRGFGDVKEFDFQRIAGGAAPFLNTSGLDEGGDAIGKEASKDKKAAQKETLAMPPGLSPGEKAGHEAAMQIADAATKTPSDMIYEGSLIGLPSDAALAERLVKRDRTRAMGLYGKGTAVGTVQLRAKGQVTIDGIAPWAQGDWYVARVNHIYTRVVEGNQDRSTYETKFVVTR
jgi:phage protein D